MIGKIRNAQKSIWWVVIALLGISFVFYFSNADVGAIGSDQFGRIYDRTITRIEFQKNARLFNLARELGMFGFLQDLVTGASSEAEAYAEFTWNRLILRHEAARLGLRPSASEIAEVVKGLRTFRGESGFESKKYEDFARNALPAMGFTEAQLEELAGDQVRLTRVKDLLGTGVHIAEAESRENYERAYGKMDVSVVRLGAQDLAKDVKISDEEIAKYYEAHKTELKTEEKRKVESVSFALTEEQKKLTGKERIEPLQKLADRANDFNQALLEPGADFHQLAAKFQLPILTTGEFTRAAPDAQFSALPQLTESAFQLTAQAPNTDALQAGDGFHVLHLSGLAEARPLSLEEGKPKIVEAIKSDRLREMVARKGSEAARKIREALKAGTPLEGALQQAGLKAEKIPSFSLAQSPMAKAEAEVAPKTESPDLPMIKSAVAEMAPGEVSEFVPAEGGGLVAILEKREPPNAAEYEMGKAMFAARYLRSKRGIVFYEWLRERRQEAKIQAAAS